MVAGRYSQMGCWHDTVKFHETWQLCSDPTSMTGLGWSMQNGHNVHHPNNNHKITGQVLLELHVEQTPTKSSNILA